ncbi:hypothetical protein B566_EDAN010046 [Ephemera danica]|nr:hypothetical protein B566_EDAN010046 [Ephemera danica]
MNFVPLALLLCCAQVFADAVDVTQTLHCDGTVQKQHRILLQFSRAHLISVRSAIKNINDSLHGLTQHEHDVTEQPDKSRELVTLLQDVLSEIKNNGADGVDENRIFKQRMENGITDLKLRFFQLDFKLKVLNIEKKTNELQLKQMQTQERKLEMSISHQAQFRSLDNIETHLDEQLERTHETLELERQWCQFKLEAFSTLMKARLEQVELTNNTQICHTKAAKPTTWTPPTGAVTLSAGIYFFNYQMLNWTSAREHCKSLLMGLVAIETESEDVAISNHAAKVFVGPAFWTSGCYSSSEDAVVWCSTGQKVNYTNWWKYKNMGNTQDVNRCVALDPYEKHWWESVVSIERASICERM